MHSRLLTGLFASAAAVSASEFHSLFRRDNDTAGVAAACADLSSRFPSQVLTSSSANYTAERTAYWDIRSDQSPSCIFLPVDASQVATAMTVLVRNQAEFAVRGGGHMNVGFTCSLRQKFHNINSKMGSSPAPTTSTMVSCSPSTTSASLTSTILPKPLMSAPARGGWTSTVHCNPTDCIASADDSKLSACPA